MMRSPHFIAVALRKPNQRIVIRSRPYSGVHRKYPILRKPILRGVVTLIESLIQGTEALSFSAQIASESLEDDSRSAQASEGHGGIHEEAPGKSTGEKLSGWAIGLSMGFAFIFGMGLFVALPHFLTVLLTSQQGLEFSVESPVFHLLDGMFKMAILLLYVYLIALMQDIHRVFQYHGAEHKSIYAFEAGEELTVENARKHTTLHPRCGTSFLLFLVLISVVVFSIVFPIFNLTRLSSIPILNHIIMIFVKIGLMLPVAGLAYEFIKACAFRMNHPLFRALIWPGLMLQKLTTREPSDDQLEVALASLRQVLKLEKVLPGKPDEVEISALAELGLVDAQVAEFPEG